MPRRGLVVERGRKNGWNKRLPAHYPDSVLYSLNAWLAPSVTPKVHFCTTAKGQKIGWLSFFLVDDKRSNSRLCCLLERGGTLLVWHIQHTPTYLRCAVPAQYSGHWLLMFIRRKVHRPSIRTWVHRVRGEDISFRKVALHACIYSTYITLYFMKAVVIAATYHPSTVALSLVQ